MQWGWGAVVEEASSGEILGWYQVWIQVGHFLFLSLFSPPSLPQSQFWELESVLDRWTGTDHTVAFG